MQLSTTALYDTASQELDAAMATVSSDDEASRFAKDAQRLVGRVNDATSKADAAKAALHANGDLTPAAKTRRLTEIADQLGATTTQLVQAENDLILFEGIHLKYLLRPSRDDATLREELHHYTVNLRQENAVVSLVQLAADVRYSAILAGPMGAALGARFNFDSGVLRRAALQALATHGTEDQVRRLAQLAAVPALRRALGLARGARDYIVSEIQPKATNAMMG